MSVSNWASHMSLLFSAQAKVTLASAPRLLPAWSISDSGSSSGGFPIGSGSNGVLIGFAIYLIVGACVNTALYMRTKRRQPRQGTALLLWVTFGPLGAHR